MILLEPVGLDSRDVAQAWPAGSTYYLCLIILLVIVLSQIFHKVCWWTIMKIIN